MKKLMTILTVAALLALGFAGRAQVASAVSATLDFEGVEAHGGLLPGLPLNAYLAGFGISISHVSHPGAVDVADDTLVYGGGVVGAPSPHRYLTIEPGGAPPVSFTLDFAQPLNSFSFTFCAILVPSIVPAWSATALDSGGGVLDMVSDGLKGRTFPATTYTLTGPGIVSVRFDANGFGFAAFSGPLIDDVVIDPTPELSIAVEIDIKPGSFPNSINCRNRNGLIPVAILTTSTLAGESVDFNATTVDPLSVQFGPAGATETHSTGHIEDVDGDGDLDMVLHFRVSETVIQCGHTEVCLTGVTIDGTPIQGCAAVRTVGG